MNMIKKALILFMVSVTLFCGFSSVQPAKAAITCAKSGCTGGADAGTNLMVNCKSGHQLYVYTCSKCGYVFYACQYGHVR